ncbi:hypothetical protein LPJ75_006576, partial [Coemansia sp. RSA 2598]
VENLCRPTPDGLFSQPMPSPLPPAEPIEDMTAIIVSADTKGNIRVFRKDINAPEPAAKKPDVEGAASDDVSSVHSGSGTTRSRPASLIRVPFSLKATSSASQLLQQQQQQQPPRPPSARGPPSLWTRLGRRVSQRRASSHGSFANAHAASSPLAKDFSDQQQPNGNGPGVENPPGACAYCGHPKLIEFTVTSQTSADATNGGSSSSSNPRLLVCEKCKRVCNMPATE